MFARAVVGEMQITSADGRVQFVDELEPIQPSPVSPAPSPRQQSRSPFSPACGPTSSPPSPR